MAGIRDKFLKLQNACKAKILAKGDVLEFKRRPKIEIKKHPEDVEADPQAVASMKARLNEEKYNNAVKNQNKSAAEKFRDKTRSRAFRVEVLGNYAHSWANSVSQAKYDDYHKRRAPQHYKAAKQYAKKHNISDHDFNKIMSEHYEAEMGKPLKKAFEPYMSE